MKITYISNSSCPSHVPSSLQIVKTCEYLSKEKNDVSLIIPNTSQSKLSINKFYDVKSKFKIIRLLNFKKFPLGLDYYYFSISSFLKAKKNSEIIISRNFFVIFLSVLFKKKCILEIHHDIQIESRIVQFIYKYFNILSSKSLLKIIAISNAVKENYKKQFYINDQKKIIVLPSGSSLKFNFQIPIKKERLSIGYFGSINTSKGIDLIIKLSKYDKYNDYFIYGGLKEQVFKLKLKNHNKNLFIYSHLNYKELKKKIILMDILLMPYTSNVTAAGEVSNITKYTSPLKLFDYMSAGKLVLSSELDTLKEVLKDKKNCLFVKNFSNPFSWLNKIKLIKNNLVMRGIISKNSHISSNKFHHEKRIKKYLEI